MKRLWVLILTCAIGVFNFVVPSAVQAQPFLPFAQVTGATEDAIAQLKNEILPELEKILTPEQGEQFKTAIAEGTSFRKAFKSVNLTPDQKTKLKTLLKSIPSKASFASLTPEQKKQLFMEKKKAFMPTPEEISQKISDRMKLQNKPSAN